MGCEYISNLPFCKEQRIKKAIEKSLDEFPKEEVDEFYEYVFNHDSFWKTI